MLPRRISSWLKACKAIELIELSPSSQENSTHCSQVPACFDISNAYDEHFLLSKSRKISNLHPIHDGPAWNAVQVASDIAQLCEARHTLSLMLRGGKDLLYFEPGVTEGRKQD